MDLWDRVKVSYENSKRLTEQSLKMNHQIQELLMKGFREERKQIVSEINKAVYDLAEKNGMSVYDICYHYMPDERDVYPSPQLFTDPKGATRVTITKELRLVPMQFELEKGPGYWKGKYYELKRRMRELIDNKEI